MTSTERSFPPLGHPEHAGWRDDSCARCEHLEQKLKHIRDERNELLVRIYELERNGAAAAERRPASSQPRHPTLLGVSLAQPSAPHETLPAMQAAAQLPARQPERSGVHLALGGRDAEPHSLQHGGVMARGQGLDFGAIARLTPEQLDTLPYGLITLDAEGRVVHYNDTESRLAGLPKERVVGRNFFIEVAPCTRVRAFEGRFRELAQDPTAVRVQSFDFTFAFSHSEQQVSIVMTPARRRGHFHLALIRRAIQAR